LVTFGFLISIKFLFLEDKVFDKILGNERLQVFKQQKALNMLLFKENAKNIDLENQNISKDGSKQEYAPRAGSKKSPKAARKIIWFPVTHANYASPVRRVFQKVQIE
jgi:hypothetical protein